MKVILRCKDKSMFCQILPINIVFYDSYRVKSSKEMGIWIDKAKRVASKSTITDYPIFQRGKKSMIREWKAHNLLYKLGIARSHTKDVDLNKDQKWYIKCGYFLLSCLYFY